MTQAFIPGPIEFWIILVVALLLFGHRIPSMARSLGSGIVEFKRGLKGGEDPKSASPDEITGPGTGNTGSANAAPEKGQEA